MSEPIDQPTLDALLDSIGGDRDFLIELIETFLLDAPEQFSAMHAALEHGRPEALRRAAHSLKSNSESFGALALAELAREIESQAKEGGLESARALLPQAEAAYADASSSLEQLVN